MDYYPMKVSLIIILLLITYVGQCVAANINPKLASEKGKKAFEDNCKACHALDKFSTGPSALYIRDTYPKDALKAFLAWSNNPGKKNPNTIQMPPMAHLGETTLTDIHQYLTELKNAKNTKPEKPKFPPFKRPERAYPYLQRGYMPFTSPASISISLSPELSVVWDTVAGKLRYAYPTGMQMNGEKRREENRTQLLYEEFANVPFSFMTGKEIKFKGYDLIEGSPEFIYKVGEVELREKITLGHSSRSFIRYFTISGIAEPISLDLRHLEQAKLHANKGEISDQILNLTAQEAANFSVEVSL